MRDLKRILEKLSERDPWDYPESADADIDAGLQSDEADVRRLAISLASTGVEPHRLETLLKIAQGDKEPELAAAAAIALGPALEESYLDDPGESGEGVFGPDDAPTISPALYRKLRDGLRALHDDTARPLLVRRRALEAAVRAPEAWMTEATRAAYAAPELEWRSTAVFCMGYLQEFDDAILEALKSDEAPIKFEALRAAGERELAAAGKEVLRVAGDPEADKDLRLAAIEALESLDVPGAEELLEDLVEKADDELAEAAEAALEERSISSFGVDDLDDLEDEDEDEDGEDEDDEDEDEEDREGEDKGKRRPS